MSCLIIISSKLRFFIPVLLLVLLSLGSSGPGTVYIVLGSDTAIWQGMNPGAYNCEYNPALYVDPGNTFTVMDPKFRGKFTDSFGDTMKLTWWMMEGNIFRYAVNNNIPYPNIMTMYLMKKFHGDNIKLLGDELSLHYHTFTWSDYNGDGRYYWNQAKSFTECYDDFNYTLAQTFLEEEIFPVSFRSGWHYMDNEWQNHLNKLLPYSLHNDYPAKRYTEVEPIDNVYDWSLSPSEFIPFNPSPENYQLPGESKGWNVRSIHLNTIKNYTTLLNNIFSKANDGIDHVVCIWGHLPEVDFNTNLAVIDSLLHKYESLYPNVKFKYSTGIEAMKLYRGGIDNTPPALSVQEIYSSNQVTFNISTDEPIFQEYPFVAYKDLNNDFHLAECTVTGINTWTATIPVAKEFLAKAGVVLSDTLGNQAYKIFRYVPDDIFIDNTDPKYKEDYGSWASNTAYAWGNDSRSAILSENDSAKITWSFSIQQDGNYHIFTQFPQVSDHASRITFLIHSQNNIDTVILTSDPVKKSWIYLSTVNFLQGDYIVEMLADGAGQSGKYICADILKLTPLVREKAIQFSPGSINLGEIAQGDSLLFEFELKNNGINPLTISDIRVTGSKLYVLESFPVIIEPMGGYNIKMKLINDIVGSYSDSIKIISDDFLTPELLIQFSAGILPYFVIIDNEETVVYHETMGTWSNSVAQSYGPTSRIAYLNQSPRASAYVEILLPKEGTYLLQYVVPKTENAATKALYKIFIDGIMTDSIFINQNINSGTWVTIGEKYLLANNTVRIEITDPGGSLGAVLRTDAFRFGILNAALSAEENNHLPLEFDLSQNYPNPFNPVTKIKYSIPVSTGSVNVRLTVYDIIGRTIAELVNEVKTPGIYETEFDGSLLASGIYICRLNAGKLDSTIKMVLLK